MVKFLTSIKLKLKLFLTAAVTTKAAMRGCGNQKFCSQQFIFLVAQSTWSSLYMDKFILACSKYIYLTFEDRINVKYYSVYLFVRV